MLMKQKGCGLLRKTTEISVTALQRACTCIVHLLHGEMCETDIYIQCRWTGM